MARILMLLMNMRAFVISSKLDTSGEQAFQWHRKYVITIYHKHQCHWKYLLLHSTKDVPLTFTRISMSFFLIVVFEFNNLFHRNILLLPSNMIPFSKKKILNMIDVTRIYPWNTCNSQIGIDWNWLKHNQLKDISTE